MSKNLGLWEGKFVSNGEKGQEESVRSYFMDSKTLILIFCCLFGKQAMGKEVYLFMDLNYGISSTMT